MVVLQSETYGSPGTDIFATYEELKQALGDKIPIYVLKMAPQVEQPGVRAMLRSLQGATWGIDTPLPVAALDDICKLAGRPNRMQEE
jgi:hypothetical protein